MRHNLEEAVNPEFAHIPIMWREMFEFVEGSASGGKGTLVDCTLGEGGHSDLFLRFFPDLKVIAFERDPEILEVAGRRLSVHGDRISFANSNFSEAAERLSEMGARADYVLYDFGISSFHFDRSGRGFGFKEDEPLDMRLGSNSDGLTAERIVNRFSEDELTDIFYRYGEENWSRHIARIICERRQKRPLMTTGELAQLVLEAIPKKFHVRNIHPATRIFQAIRIRVNDELTAIESALKGIRSVCAPGALIMAMSFHSLEDRIVKERFRLLHRGCECGHEPKMCVCTNKPFVEILTKKPLMAQEDEVALNRRSRSARLRVCRVI